MDYSQYSLAKTGYLKEDFRLFHINDRTDREFEWHYHDFHKIIVFVSGKVTYHIEGKAYHLKPQDILLVSQGAIHKPEIDRRCHMNAIFSGFVKICHVQSSTPVSRKPTTAASTLSVWILPSRNASKTCCPRSSSPCVVTSLGIIS